MNNKIESVINKLSNSKFRSSFKLKEKDINYINDKTLPIIKEHAYDFIKKRISPSQILNDGKQTPMKGHPVFIAQHATATCCRDCLFKWHQIEKNKTLTKGEEDYIVEVIMKWITRQLN